LSASPIRQPEPVYRDRLLRVGAVPDTWVRDLAEFYEVTAVPTLGALAAVRARRPDAVLLQVAEGGLELLRELKRDPETREIPVLLLGASGTEERCLDGLETGASDYLVEPFSHRSLAARVASCLRSGRARREALLRERDLLAEAQMAAEALDRSEERFQAFLRYSPVASWMTDEEGRVLFLSEPYTRMFGLRPETSIGRSLFDLYPLPFAP
jgi:DNA-binding response OmpR family regulator